MCPDDKLLSAYFDGEVASPWNERLKSHIEHCSACAAKLDRMKAFSASIRAVDGTRDNEALAEAKERIWARLSTPRTGESAHIYRFRDNKLWSRRIELPLPIIAAAAAALLFASGLALGILRIGGSGSNLASVKKYLENQNSSQALMINLPNVSNYNGQNEPVLMIKSEPSSLSQFSGGNGGSAP